ncbi:unnamed protein product [Ranitomeya imitator]|uniref:SGNH hydrolase-type esterase domain-containing protein n=1 Tax=Ranitomeya imitator TaxID=111125 RepID=A0ABN9L6W8_9NEOB|nr:unnamed protein product [Ranitomeya imitator]
MEPLQGPSSQGRWTRSPCSPPAGWEESIQQAGPTTGAGFPPPPRHRGDGIQDQERRASAALQAPLGLEEREEPGGGPLCGDVPAAGSRPACLQARRMERRTEDRRLWERWGRLPVSSGQRSAASVSSAAAAPLSQDFIQDGAAAGSAAPRGRGLRQDGAGSGSPAPAHQHQGLQQDGGALWRPPQDGGALQITAAAPRGPAILAGSPASGGGQPVRQVDPGAAEPPADGASMGPARLHQDPGPSAAGFTAPRQPGPPQSAACSILLHTMERVAKGFGVPLAADKTVGPVTTLSFLGIEIDTVAMECRLPDDKLVAFREEVRKACTWRKITLHDLQSLLGKLNFACRIMPMGRAFCRRLSLATVGVKSPLHFIRLTKELKQDLKVWALFLEEYNGKSIWIQTVENAVDLGFSINVIEKRGFNLWYRVASVSRAEALLGFIVPGMSSGAVEPAFRAVKELFARSLSERSWLHYEQAWSTWESWRVSYGSVMDDESKLLLLVGHVWESGWSVSKVKHDRRLVWIMGHSFVFWAAERAAVRLDGCQLGFSRDVATLRWIGKRGMTWSQFLPDFHRFVRWDQVPQILVIHLGGNDLGKRPCRELIKDIKFDVLRLWAMFPKVLVVWSDIVPRKVWQGARSPEGVNRARIKVNKAVSRFMARNGEVVVRHINLESGTGGYWRLDGVHLNAVGTDMWCLAIQEGIETALKDKVVS